MDIDKIFEKMTLEIESEWRGNDKMLVVTPVIDIDADSGATLIASFHIDSMEMIESSRISISEGRNHLPFRQKARIYNPALWHPRPSGTGSMYEFKVVFFKDGRAHHVITKNTGVRSVELLYGRNAAELIINGEKIPCRNKDIDFTLPYKELDALCAKYGINFTVVKASAPEAEANLSICDRLGVVAALEISSQEESKGFGHHPSLCLFTAENKLSGLSRGKFHLPFLFKSELGLLE